MYPIVTSNYLLQLVATLLQRHLNSGHMLQLYQNDLTPTPANIIPDFQRSNFLGYVPYNMAGNVPAPIKQQDGQYTISFTTTPFACEGGIQVVYGALITQGSNLKFAQRFAAPITMVAGTSFVLPVVISVMSLSLFTSPMLLS